MIFPVSFDRSVYWITGGISLVFTAIVASQVATYLMGGAIVPLLTCLLLAALYFYCFLLRVTCYEVTGEYLHVRRPLRTRIIRRSDIDTVELLPKEALQSSLRVFGNGGLFGYYGKFTNRRIGAMTWYATRRDNIVLVRMAGGEKIIITPNDPDTLEQALKEKIERGTEVPL